MIVADARAIAELILAGERARVVRDALAQQSELHVPEHFHVEVLSVLRRYAIRRELREARAAVALAALDELRAVRYPVMALAADVWELRNRLTAYDAAYLVLAERLRAPLLTLDAGLAEVARGRCVTLPA